MKKAKASEDKARNEAERCRKMSNQAIKEHATMKEHYQSNLNKLKWTENKFQAESESLGSVYYLFRRILFEILWFKLFYVFFSAQEKEKTARLNRELKQAKEETSQIRANTQQIIQTYQVSCFR